MTLRILIPMIALAGCTKPLAQKNERPKPKPIQVETVAIVEREVPSTLLLAGTLKANQESDLAANASGKVLRTMVERGSYVSSGQAVAQLDIRMASLSENEAEANVETARTQRSAAQAECARYDRLFQRGIITQQEYERQTTSCKTATSSTAAAETHVELAKETLSNGTVRAPFAGLVSERFVAVGEYVMPSTRVAHIVDIDPLRLELTIPEQNMAAVQKGLKVDFQVAAFPNRTFSGVVHYIGPSVRATTRDLVFEALVPNKEKLLRPGLFATAHLDAGTQKLPVVPTSALKQDGETTRAFAIVEKHVEERLVQVGPTEGDLTAILKGLSAGERVAAHPSDQISDGTEVE
jgi:membrane fusion protein, multidrug efflux system